jgi:putative phage-type endonuclease
LWFTVTGRWSAGFEWNVDRLQRELAEAVEARNLALLEVHDISEADRYLSGWRDDPTIRETFIGGSDVAAIIGEHPTKNNLTIWLDKTGQGEPFEGSELVEWGTRLERSIVDAWAERQPDGDTVAHMEGTWKHPSTPYLGASPDGLVFRGDRSVGVIEAKNVSQWFGDEWQDDCPDRHIVQGLHNASVIGADFVVVIGLVGGNDLREYVFELAEYRELVEVIQGRLADFWKAVVARTPPPAQLSHPSTKRMLALVHPADYERNEVDLGSDIGDLVACRGSALARKAAASEELDAIDNTIREALGAATIGTLEGSEVLSWKPNQRFDSDQVSAEHVAEYQRFDASVFRKENPKLAKTMMVPGDPTKRVLRYSKRTAK